MDEEKAVGRIVRALKPPTCPYCGTKVDHLIYMAQEWVRATVSYNEEFDELSYDGWDTVEIEPDSICYYCPECSGELFDSEEEAEKFLKGEE